MKGATTQVKVLMLIGGIMIIMLLVTSVFGKGIAFGILGIAAESEPTFLQEEIRAYLTVAATAGGDMTIEIPLSVNHRISVWVDKGISYLHVKPPVSGLGTFYSDPGKTMFFGNNCTISVTPTDVKTPNEITFSSVENKVLVIDRNGTGKNCMISVYTTGKIHADNIAPQCKNLVSTPVKDQFGNFQNTFKAECSDPSGILSVKVELKSAGSTVNYTMQLESGTSSGGIYNYTEELAAGTYDWRVYASDTYYNSMVSGKQSFSIIK